MSLIGRDAELKKLGSLRSKKSASLLVFWGRRRVGKSTLAAAHAAQFERHYIFQGLGPHKRQTNQDQLDFFAEKLSQYFQLPLMQLTSWTQAFSVLASQTQNGSVCLIFDEISWMGSKDKEFAGRLKVAWDDAFSKNPKLCLVVCGSVSSWIQKNILKKTDFVGRISYSLHVEEIALPYVSKFWSRAHTRIGTNELALALLLSGGVPKYLEELAAKESISSQITTKCFSKDGFFFQEFDRIFSDIFGARSEAFKKIILCLAAGPLVPAELAKAVPRALNGKLTEDLSILVLSGFLSAETIFSLDGNPSDRVIYRLKDNYLRFYLKLIAPKKRLIDSGRYAPADVTELSGWQSFKGLQFENLVFLAMDRIFELLSIPKSKIVSAGPYFQKKNKTNSAGCQIDLLIHAKDSKYYVCEIKSGSVTSKITSEVDQKISALRLPRKNSVRAVLISLEDSVPASVGEYFDSMLFFKDLVQ
jgi:AAA+ ATPase superfamily predicted ATPase